MLTDAIPSHWSVSAENVSLGCLDDCQHARLVFALGVKVRRLEAVSTRSVEQLELLVAQLAELDQVFLYFLVADYC